MYRFCGLLLCVLCWSPWALSATVYRYQDAQGRWHFTDRQPKQQHDTLEMVERKGQKDKPQLSWGRDAEKQKSIVAINPLFCPVQFELWQDGKRIVDWVVEPLQTAPLLIKGKPLKHWADDFEYRYRLGRPIKRSDGKPLRPPVPKLGKYLISQGFKGHFSHNQEPNINALDIAMNISDQIHAARDGVVVEVKDDYHMGGVDKYFLDKANFISVLHSDDTMAIYAHILLGSAVVHVGQKIKAGDPLANAGTSGYSTGPHLHFVLRANDGKREISLPFQFKLPDKKLQWPQARQWLTNQEQAGES